MTVCIQTLLVILLFTCDTMGTPNKKDKNNKLLIFFFCALCRPPWFAFAASNSLRWRKKKQQLHFHFLEPSLESWTVLNSANFWSVRVYLFGPRTWSANLRRCRFPWKAIFSSALTVLWPPPLHGRETNPSLSAPCPSSSSHTSALPLTPHPAPPPSFFSPLLPLPPFI